jgi:signal transduction histidine kinase
MRIITPLLARSEPLPRTDLEPIRLQRTQVFLRTHLGLTVLATLFAVAETAMGLQHERLRVWLSLGSTIVPTLYTLAAFALFRRRIGIGWIIQGMLALDSVIVLAQVYQEGGLEGPWSTTTTLLIFMLPLFSEKRQGVWWLATLQATMMVGFLAARSLGWLPYDLRTTDFVHDASHQLYVGLGYVFFFYAVAILAGRASVDVLNSQRQLVAVLERQERELQVAQARIVQQEKMVSVGQLTAGMAHEINNPLTFVRTNLTSLERDMGDLVALLERYQSLDDKLAQVAPEEVEALREMREDLCLDDPRQALGELVGDAREGVERVQRIIHDLRVFARLDEAERKAVDIREGIESTLKILRHRFDERQTRVEPDLRPIPEIEVYPALLNQVIMNLLQNACDVVPPGTGLIRVSTFDEAGGVCIEVADNGPGVPPELRERVFDPFFTTKDVGAGTGLGLSLSYQIVEKHGGRLELGDAPEGGALFRVVLPRGGIPT